MLEYGSELIIVAAYMVPSVLGAHERDPKVPHFYNFRVQESKNDLRITFGGGMRICKNIH